MLNCLIILEIALSQLECKTNKQKHIIAKHFQWKLHYQCEDCMYKNNVAILSITTPCSENNFTKWSSKTSIRLLKQNINFKLITVFSSTQDIILKI